VNGYEIDVQPTKDGNVIVYHDDVSDRNLVEMPTDLPTLEEFLRFSPEGISLNIEIKKYANSTDIAATVLALCEKFKGKFYTFSSFDKSVYEFFLAAGKDAWHLQDKIEKYDASSANICEQKDMLGSFNIDDHARVLVYDVKVEGVNEMQASYPQVSGWIVDYPWPV